MSSSSGSKTKALCVATRCMTAEQFVATFHRFCDETSFFVATLNTRPVGLETPFAIQLADRTPVLRGLCVVLDAWTTPANQFKRPGIRLGIRRLTADSQEVFTKLQHRRAASSAEPPPDDDGSPEATTPDSPALPESHAPPPIAPAAGAILPKPPPIPRLETRTPPAAVPVVRAESPKPAAITPAEIRPLFSPKPSVLSTQPLAFVKKPPAPKDEAPGKPAPALASKPAPKPEATPAPAIKPGVPELASAPSQLTKPLTALMRPPALSGPIPAPTTPEPTVPAPAAIEPAAVAPAAVAPAAAIVEPRAAIVEPAAAIVEPAAAIVEPAPANPAPPAPPEPPPESVAPAPARPLAVAAAPHALEKRASKTPITPMRGNTASGLITRSALTPASTSLPSSKPATEDRAPAPAKPAVAPFVDLATYAALAEPSHIGQPPAPTDGRVPGSDLVLPANPLMGLNDESIEGFVDCTLYEETANFLKAPDEFGDDDDLAAPPPPAEPSESSIGAHPATMPARVATPPGLPVYGVRPATMPPPTGSLTPPGIPAYDPGATRSPTIPPWATPPGMPGPDAPINIRLSTPPPDSIPTADAMATFDGPPAYAMSATMPAQASELAEPQGYVYQHPPYPSAPYPSAPINGMAMPGHAAHHAPAADVPRSRAARRWVWIAAPSAAVAIIVTVVILTRGDGAPAQPPPPPQGSGSTVQQATSPPVVPRDAAVANVTPDAGEVADVEDVEDPHESSSIAGGAPVVGDGPCLLTVTTTPAGSIVQLDGAKLGPSPITIAGPCTRRRVDITHPRYKAATQFVQIKAEKPNALDVVLVRPTHSLTVTTMPPGATILIGGRRAGTSPTVIQVMGFSGMNITVQKPGWKSQTRRVYSKVAQDKLFIKLGK